MRKVCYEVLTELGLENDRLFKLAMELEKIALEDPYFVEKKLYPNVDFYSGIVQKALGIPTSMFYLHLRAGTDGGLDYPVGRDDYRSGIQDRSSAATVHRRRTTRRCTDRAARLKGRRGGDKSGTRNAGWPLGSSFSCSTRRTSVSGPHSRVYNNMYMKKSRWLS